MILNLLRLLLRVSYYLPFPKLSDWLWHAKMDRLYRLVGEQSRWGW